LAITHPKLSVAVIIPTYNRAELITKAIDSLLVQTQVPDEIIVVDDGSTDNTKYALQSYGAPVTVIAQANQERAVARNTGLQHATADLIAFLDADDQLLPESIEKRAALLQQQSTISVVYSDIYIIDLGGNRKRRYSDMYHIARPSGNVFATIARNNLMPIHAFMFRRQCIEKCGLFDTSAIPIEDYDFWLRMAAYYEFIYLNEVLGVYYFHDLMSTETQREKWLRNESQIHRRVFSMPAFQTLSGAEQSQIYRAQGNRFAAMGEMQDARRWYKQAMMRRSVGGVTAFLLTFLGKNNFRRAMHLRQRLRGDTILLKNS
jgi:glycosyltransferase involved in cell wall biosynthesis